MPLTMVDARFSFLASGPIFRLSVPSEFDTLPSLSSPMSNGIGGRSFDFLTDHQDEGLNEGHKMLAVLADRDGRTVELYERLDPPRLWWLRWPLSNGAIYAHVREEDGLGRGRLFLEYISVVEDASVPTPFLLADPPLGLAVSARPGFQERVRFFSPALGDNWVITLQRPGFLSSGQRMQLPRRDAGEFVVLRAGTSYGIEVIVWSGTALSEGQEILDGVVESLREA
jgi:hypothetical protein